ncbi:MAG: hypothetical protein HY736_22180 [Verrucomicrobia bacterium]|nr:hypothetical protein [Verrucomicrobiota bacterium]
MAVFVAESAIRDMTPSDCPVILVRVGLASAAGPEHALAIGGIGCRSNGVWPKPATIESAGANRIQERNWKERIWPRVAGFGLTPGD